MVTEEKEWFRKAKQNTVVKTCQTFEDENSTSWDTVSSTETQTCVTLSLLYALTLPFLTITNLVFH